MHNKKITFISRNYKKNLKKLIIKIKYFYKIFNVYSKIIKSKYKLYNYQLLKYIFINTRLRGRFRKARTTLRPIRRDTILRITVLTRV